MNKHETARAHEIADAGEILRTQVGSGLHGVTIDGHDDRDEMGVCIEPPSCVIGLERFEQYQYRTQPEGARSGPGDLDLVVYSLRKWARLAAQGNPTVLMLLFAPDQEIVIRNEWGERLQANRELFISRECGRRFLGYLKAQKEQMLGLRSKHTNRPELIETYGFDTKFAYHALRLGIQGIELLSEGSINLPMKAENRLHLRNVRTGYYTKAQVLGEIDCLYEWLDGLTNTVDLPDKPDYGKVDSFLIDMHQSHWNSF
ncbi:nucleotidyltransferase domain-containing protein [Mycolicibacterium septicum]|uniref:nucleotidyltransferase domain-containing protein n=1 Tax=Mycolicibacterium septicum TaxID=98668 RepID=UPI001AF1AED8|nr:nucleotidyltransferase domain-containing protein [Mycolicibacterium septicum]QRY51714.1 nucleotidyltransferase domain-containing protein [Mycolicibacterium septicum]